MTTISYIEVAVPTPLFQTFTYKLPVAADDGAQVCAPLPGCRVLVPFGRQKMVGVVLAVSSNPPAGLDPSKLKAAIEIVDDETLFAAPLLKLA
ncbi:MAG: primosomal protein N', partial [Proteobacteria bacterium]|nr:primosomal protein N' [Pseudomonadota bacterium]